MTRDERFMKRCIELARQAKSRGNTPVGALVAIGTDIVVEAFEESPGAADRFAHAELIAVRSATQALERKRFPNATMYTTAEPCFMCGFAIREAAIGRVVIGTPTPQIGSVTSKYPILVAADVATWSQPPVVEWGILASECALLRREQ